MRPVKWLRRSTALSCASTACMPLASEGEEARQQSNPTATVDVRRGEIRGAGGWCMGFRGGGAGVAHVTRNARAWRGNFSLLTVPARAAGRGFERVGATK